MFPQPIVVFELFFVSDSSSISHMDVMPADYQHLAIAPSYPPNSGGSLLWIFFQWVLNLILCLWISGSVDQ